MNFGEKESFFVKHRYFFQNYYFKFEGLSDEIQTGFEDIVKRLSGVICRDADYILTETSYFKKTINKNRTDLYSIHYILDSMTAKQPLDINSYRFLPEKMFESTTPCCLFSKYVLRTNSCTRYYNDNVRCRFCSSNSPQESVLNTVVNNTTAINNINNISVTPNETELKNKNVISDEMANLSIESRNSKEDDGKKMLKKLNGISNWKVKPETRLNHKKNIQEQLATILLYTEDKNERKNSKKNLMFNGTRNINSKLPTISIIDDETNESIKKLKMCHEKSIKIQKVSESSNLKKFNKNPKENSKMYGSQDNFKKVRRNVDNSSLKNSSLQNDVKNSDSKEKNESTSKSEDNDKQTNKSESKEIVLSDNEWILSSSDDTSANYKKSKISTCKRTRRTNSKSSSDSSIGLSDSSNILNDNGGLKKTSHKKIYAKKRSRRNVSIDRHSSSSSEDGVDKIYKKIRKFNTGKMIKTKVSKYNSKEIKQDKGCKSSCGELSFSSSDEIFEHESNEWWFHLPPKKKGKADFEEYKRNVGDRRRGTTFSLQEQRLMIAYLIRKKKIHLATSRLPWREIHNDGYMRNRSSESLSNNFRRIVLPKIRTYGLPNEILLQFLSIKN